MESTGGGSRASDPADWVPGQKTGQPCPRCDVEELERSRKTDFLACPGCFFELPMGQLGSASERARKRLLTREARECFFEEMNRPHEPGGSDDRMAVQVLRPLGDERMVRVTSRRQVVTRSRPLRVRGLDCSSAEALAALQEFFERNEVA